MKLIELTQGRVAIVDDEDFEWLSKWKWYFHRSLSCKTGYAQRTNRSGKQQTLPMHVTIMRRHGNWSRGKEVDHINTCDCDNRKENLRLATRDVQVINKQRRADNTSSITGVHQRNDDNKWHARITVNGRRMSLGTFTHKKDAIAARRQAEIKYFSEYRHDPKLLCPLWKTGQCPDCAARARELGLLQ